METRDQKSSHPFQSRNNQAAQCGEITEDSWTEINSSHAPNPSPAPTVIVRGDVPSFSTPVGSASLKTRLRELDAPQTLRRRSSRASSAA